MRSRNPLLVLEKRPALLADGQEDREHGAFSDFAPDRDLAAVAFDVAQADAQSEPGALALLRGEEGVEYLLQILWRDAPPGIADLDLDELLELDLGGLGLELSAAGHGLGGVDEHVRQDLTDLVEVGGDLGQPGGKDLLDPDAAEDGLMAQEGPGVVDQLGDVDLGELRRGRPGEVGQSADGLGDPVDVFQNDLDLLLPGFLGGLVPGDLKIG